jgi:hypothetical protein
MTKGNAIMTFAPETTKISLNLKGRPSLKTIIPLYIARQINLQKGEELNWILEKYEDGEYVMKVRRVKDSLKRSS